MTPPAGTSAPAGRLAATVARITAFEASDSATAEARRAVLDLLSSAGERAFERTHLEPGHLTASAWVLPPGGGEVLLVHHARLGRWLQPGGHVEPGDPDLLAAARREVEEECGIRPSAHPDPLLDLDVHRIPARPGEPAHLHFDVRFLLVAPSRAVRTGDGVRAVRWVSLAGLAEAGTDASVLRAVARIAARSAAV